METYGFLLDYSNDWRGFLMRAFGLFTFCVTLFSDIFFAYNVTIGSQTLEAFSDALSCFGAATECLLKISVFYLNRRKFLNLIAKITEILESGESLSVESFDKIAGYGRRLLLCYFISATSTGGSMVLFAVVKNILESTRLFPFKGR